MMTDALVWAVGAVGAILVAGCILRMATKMVCIEGATFGRSMLVALFCGIVSSAVVAMVMLLLAKVDSDQPATTIHATWAGAVLVMAISVAIVRRGFRISFGRALAVWCAAVGLAVVLGVVATPLLHLFPDILHRIAAGT